MRGTQFHALGDSGLMAIVSESAWCQLVSGRIRSAKRRSSAPCGLPIPRCQNQGNCRTLKASPEEAVDRVAILVEERQEAGSGNGEAKKALALPGWRRRETT